MIVLAIHMKDIGISVENIAIIYAILPFTALVSSPAIGFLADKLGSFTRVLMLTLVGDAVFYGLLLAVPHFNKVTQTRFEVLVARVLTYHLELNYQQNS